ncbi:S-layer homology domain-containing protein [Paenibacillus thermotolerans]|uniref:S-layer homology domain-containing protein n=1 Tax=Paenibacillus thermotolerans TaxID=3027807 RepID=UPI0023686CDE|nr:MULTISPECIES: S-layer homology domain-containing protein [unclassified Paenibacillus]
MNIRKLAVVGALSMSLTVGSASAFAASLEDTVGLDGEVSINKLVALNVFSAKTTFQPEEALTRGELANILNKVLTLTTPKTAPKIADVVTANGANAKIASVVGNGYIGLKNGSFVANAGVTYGELSKALAYGLGFKASWSDRAIDTFYYLERKGILSIDTDLDEVVTREDAAVIIDAFLSAKGYYNTDNGVVSALTDTGVVINNGSEYVEYKLAGNAALFIGGQNLEVSAFGPGTPVSVALNANGEIAYMTGGILGLIDGTIEYSGGKLKVNGAAKNVDLNVVVSSLPNSPNDEFTFKHVGNYGSVGVTFGGSAYVNEENDEITMLQLYLAKIEGKDFAIANGKVTVDFSGDALANQSFEVASDAKIVLDSAPDKAITLEELAKLQANNTLSGVVEADSDGIVTAITAKVTAKEKAQ